MAIQCRKWNIGIILLSGWGVLACNITPSENSSGQSGIQLARLYCGSCHLPPDPDQLDKKTWRESVLPQMSWRLGIPDSLVVPPTGNSMSERFYIHTSGLFPTEAQIPDHLWERIVNYYLEASPESPLPQVVKPQIEPDFPAFEIQPVTSAGNAPGGITTMIRYHNLDQRIYLSDAAQNLSVYDLKGNLEKRIPLGKVLTDIHISPDSSIYLLSVGNINPNDEEFGELLLMDGENDIRPILKGLKRPVHLTVSDLDGDGKEDLVICEFGHQTGRLSWFRQINEHSFVRNVLIEAPGAIKTFIYDINNDQLPDVIALMAQGNEGVFAFINRGEGRFEQKILLRFSPVFGASDLALADIDGDGDPDFIIVNGDNADYSQILKHYHGVRIYRNDGQFNFEESWFYPMFGATRVVSSDFDGDGDTDIAASAYFPDFSAQTPESFVYLENRQNHFPDSLRFFPHTFPGANDGRWMLMELADLKNVGNQDILLGSSMILPFSNGHEFGHHWREKKVNFLMLKNLRTENPDPEPSPGSQGSEF